jgi:gamma-glutamylcyclotransferase (GGCT)/AIG2-like uncharacterized protein YtfP
MPQLNKQLALFEFLLNRFGFKDFKELQHQYSLKEFDSNTPDNSLFYINLSSSITFSPDDLKQYDSNLIAHLQQINRGKQTAIRLKYYQYFSLLFTEYYLHRFFSNKHNLKDELNEFIATSTKPEIKTLAPFTVEELNKLAYWNATGSGKTYILHINILQYQYYAKASATLYKNLILLTPSEDLSEQHLAELEASGIPANLYWEDKESANVKVIDIHKIREFSTGQGVTIPLSEFDRNNAIFVDEGHKGNKSEDSAWRDIRSTLSSEGFAFEYSATFGQLSDEGLLTEYAKSIVFDYSYGHFYQDGYGKDYWIHNLTDSTLLDNNEDKKRQYLLQNLLLFVQQKIYFTKHHDELLPFEIENPLLIFVGSSVEPKPKSGSLSKAQESENQEVISDVKLVLDFLNDFLQNRAKYLQWIKVLIEHSDDALFKEDYFAKLDYLITELGKPEDIYEFCLKTVFNHTTGGEMELHTLPKAEGEIALKIKGSDYYFALIYIGDTSPFKVKTETEYEFKRDTQSTSLFKTLSDRNSNPINILIGAKKFIEGWNNYRVSSIGLINFGKSKGSQIIQLFGRGVRLRGKEGSLKRSKGLPDAPKNIEIVECLNIFGLRADYMKQFKEDLEREGIKTLKKTFTFDIRLTHDLNQLQLLTLEKDSSVVRFEETDILKLEYEHSIKVNIDLSTKKFVAASDRTGVIQSSNLVLVKLSDYLLDIVDWDWVYSELLLYKKRMASPKMPNILITRSGLKDLIKLVNYRITADSKFEIKNINDVEKLNKLVLQILKQYIELFYKRQLRNYDGNNLTTKVLTEENSNIKNAQWQFEVITTDVNGNELAGISSILSKLRELSDTTTNYPTKLKGNTFVLEEWLDAHIYQPLLKDDSHQTLSAGGTNIVETIKPPGLNKGEFTFVADLRNFIASQGKRFPDLDFFLLRNMSRGHGFGFYFLSGGFYPDFMLWVKNKKTNEQYLSFIDPHGLRNEQLKWDSPKINLYKTIKGLEKKLLINNFSLNSFILQPPPDNLQDAGLDGWHREDDPKRAIPLDDYAANKHVYAIPIDGNKSGPGGYIDKIITQILTPTPKTFKYFAYGSNMSSRRLLSRCSSANFIEVAKVKGYTLSFNKKSSVDKSGKANITQTGKNTDIVWGIVFEIDDNQKPRLDTAEGIGKGYDEQTIKVTDSKGKTHDCIAYIATEAKYLDNSLVPMDWYKEHCLIGAKEHNLPVDYVSKIESQTATTDTDLERAEKERKIYE